MTLDLSIKIFDRSAYARFLLDLFVRNTCALFWGWLQVSDLNTNLSPEDLETRLRLNFFITYSLHVGLRVPFLFVDDWLRVYEELVHLQPELVLEAVILVLCLCALRLL